MRCEEGHQDRNLPVPRHRRPAQRRHCSVRFWPRLGPPGHGPTRPLSSRMAPCTCWRWRASRREPRSHRPDAGGGCPICEKVCDVREGAGIGFGPAGFRTLPTRRRIVAEPGQTVDDVLLVGFCPAQGRRVERRVQLVGIRAEEQQQPDHLQVAVEYPHPLEATESSARTIAAGCASRPGRGDGNPQARLACIMRPQVRTTRVYRA